jgi:hypothetical protein
MSAKEVKEWFNGLDKRGKMLTVFGIMVGIMMIIGLFQ